jgi:nucleoside-diphosphate-sugar epimerase
LDTGYFADCVLGPPTDEAPGIAGTAPADLRDVTIADLLGIDAVVHLAALSNDPLGSLAPEVTHQVNHHASVRLARLAKEAGVSRFVYASTCSVYGSAGDDLVNEDAPLRPLTPYAESKVRVEEDVAAIADSGFAPVFLRNATAFGFSPRLRADIVVNNLVGHAVLTGDVRVMSDGTPWRPLVHVRDIVGAFAACLTAPREAIYCKAYNVGAFANNLTVSDIAETVVEAVPGARLNITGETGADPRSYRVDFSRLYRNLGFEAVLSVPVGVAELYQRYTAYGLTMDAFTNRFTRLARLSQLRETNVIDESLRRVMSHA